MIYGYCRISTEHQVVSNQKHGIQTFADENNLKIGKWVEETISSRKPLNERKLGKLLKKTQKRRYPHCNRIISIRPEFA